ncbi:beta-galactosidase trimerization domain-containing protein, partial [Paenibacillus sepulcri]|nr:beta-galactosidase trimerization domain-containing protein [Paenibacillus sepulcri]
AGVKIEDYDCLRQFGQGIRWIGNGEVTESANLWCDIITLDGAETLAEYTEEFYANTPAITRNSYGGGFAYYVGTQLGPLTMETLVAELVRASGIRG